MRSNEYQSARILYPVLKALNSKEADTLKAAINYAWSLGEEVKIKLDILKESPKYNSEPPFDIAFRYAEPSDMMLRTTRKKFNLDKIAGKGMTSAESRIFFIGFMTTSNMTEAMDWLPEQEIWKLHTSLIVGTVVDTTAELMQYA